MEKLSVWNTSAMITGTSWIRKSNVDPAVRVTSTPVIIRPEKDKTLYAESVAVPIFVPFGSSRIRDGAWPVLIADLSREIVEKFKRFQCLHLASRFESILAKSDLA